MLVIRFHVCDRMNSERAILLFFSLGREKRINYARAHPPSLNTALFSLEASIYVDRYDVRTGRGGW